jgi:hypothetical protein
MAVLLAIWSIKAPSRRSSHAFDPSSEKAAAGMVSASRTPLTSSIKLLQALAILVIVLLSTTAG